MFRNFYNTLRRFKLSSSLNIMGLTVAFAAFIVIMMQVNYDRGYDQFHPKADHLYRLDFTTDSVKFVPYISRPMGEHILNISPYVEAGSVYSCWGDKNNLTIEGSADYKQYSEMVGKTTGKFTDMFDFQFVEGDGKSLDTPGNAILPQSVAERLFPGGDAIGKTLFVGGKGKNPMVVTGIYKDLPENSFIYNAIYTLEDSDLSDESEWSFPHYLLLTDASHKADVEKLVADWMKEEFKGYKQASFRLTPVKDIYFLADATDGNHGSKTTTMVLFGIAIMVLAIAAINFLNFSMATTPMRLKSINIHKILGSTVAKLRFQLIMESVFMALISFGLALIVVHQLASTTFAGFLTANMSFASNTTLIWSSVIVALVTGVAAGIIPAFYSTSFAPMLVIKGAFGMSPSGKRFRMALIGFQYVVSIVLIVASMLMIVQNNFMKNHPVGFDRSNVLCARISDSINNRRDGFVSKIRSNPIVKDVAFSRDPIINNGHMGWGRGFKGEQIKFSTVVTTSNFVGFMGMVMADGRDFLPEDDLKSNGTIIFNQKAADKYGIKVGDHINGHSDDLAEVVGIVKNFNFQPMQYGIEPMALYVFGTRPWWSLSFMYVRVDDANTQQCIEYIRKTMLEFDPTFVDAKVEFLDDSVGRLYEKEEKLAKLISLFGIITMVISLVGVFGLVIFETQYRRKEIGLRKINGATVGDILAMFNRKFVWLIAVCFVIASPLAWYGISRWLENFAYRTPIHWWVFALALLIVLAITVLTVTVQSWRAATENPVNSIKSE